MQFLHLDNYSCQEQSKAHLHCFIIYSFMFLTRQKDISVFWIRMMKALKTNIAQQKL